MLVQKVKLGDLLLERGLVSQEEFDSCLEEAKESGIRVGQVLIDRGYLSEDQVFRVLSEQQGFEYIDLAGIDTDSKIAAKVGGQTLKKHGAFPIREDELNIVFTFKDPLDLTAQDAIQRLFPKKILKVVGSNPVLLEKYIRQYEINESIRDLTAEIRKEIAQSTAGDGSEASSILKLINIIVESAIYARGSDIHIEPTEKNCIVRTRIDGILKESFSFDADIYPPLASRIKLLGSLDIAEKRKPQDGRFSLTSGAKEYDFRLSTLPTTYGESVVMRILDKAKVLINLEDLGMYKDNFRKFSSALKTPYGIILVTGPTGSGKTTTLYAALNAIKGVDKKIITVEDPVEYKINMVQQVQVHERAGLTFASALRSILRQDPDIIMIGEIRDQETLRIAVQAALTGHLVLSTLHTNDAISAVTRMVDMGIEPYLVGPSLIAVEAQRLIRKLCPHCKSPTHVSESALRPIEMYLPTEYTFYKAVGCDKCANTGYLGREMITEVMSITDDMATAIARNASKHEIQQLANESGFESMLYDGVRRAASGITTLEEVYRVARL